MDMQAEKPDSYYWAWVGCALLAIQQFCDVRHLAHKRSFESW